MESAIRWSHATDNAGRFLVADIAGNRLQYCQLQDAQGSTVKHKLLLQREKLQNYTAFEWFRQNESLIAIGTSSGACRIISLDDGSDVHEYPVKVQRKCNSVSFSANNLVAIGLDRTRGDSSLNIHDLGHQTGHKPSEPYRRLGGAEIITNVKFFADQPNTLVAGSAGVARAGSQSLKIFDLRDHASGPAAVTTKHVYLLSIDPADENYFLSAAAANENAITIWDKRRLCSSSAATPSQSSTSIAVLDVRPVLDPALKPEIWSVRYSGYRRGLFAAMSSAGTVKAFETSHIHEQGPWGTQTFTRRSYDLSRGLTGDSLPIAFDFAQIRSDADSVGILTIQRDKHLGFIQLPRDPPTAELSPQTELAVSTNNESAATVSAAAVTDPVAEDLVKLRATLSHHNISAKEVSWLASYERHRRFATMPRRFADLADMKLFTDAARRRCKEGYLFDCERNQDITKDNPWISGMWMLVERLKRMASNGGMMHKGLDFSFFGVHGIWTSRFVNNPERLVRRDAPSRKEFSAIVSALLGSQSYPAFEGVDTQYPGLRQLGLGICGHRFDEKRLRSKCSEIISRKDYYKAIVVAVYHGRKDIAIEMLKTLTRLKSMQDSGLAAVIVCKTISDEQRELCQWMAEEAEDPYLRALLAYFVSGTWKTVAEMAELPLIYRVAVALKYLDDDQLDRFLEMETQLAASNGDLEGIVLTGLAEPSMDLLQNYVAKFGDAQTAVLAAAFTNSRYVQDARFDAWKEAYFSQMQSWSAFIERVRFRTEHSRMNLSRTGQKPLVTTPRVKPPAVLECRHCHKSVARAAGEESDATDADAVGLVPRRKATKARAVLGASCQHCGRPFSRCAVCLLWQGSLQSTQDGVSEMDQESATHAGMIGFCMSCRHGWHPQHGRQWFAKHRECPVAGCDCHCRLLNEPFAGAATATASAA